MWESSPAYTVAWAALLLLQALLPVSIAYLTKLVIDGVVVAANSGGDWGQTIFALWLVAAMGGVLLLAEVLQYTHSWIRSGQAESFGDFLADKIHAKAAQVDFGFYESADYHDLLEQTRGDAGSKPLALLDSVGSTIQNAITILGLCALLFTYAWWLPLVLILGGLPGLLLNFIFDRKYHSWWKSTANERRWAAYFDAMLTHPNSAAEIRLFDLGAHFRNMYQSVRGRLRNERQSQLRRQSIGKIAAAVVGLITAGGTMVWMIVRVLYGTATFGDLGVFYQILFRGQGSMSALVQSAGKALSSSLYLENLFAFLDLRSTMVVESSHPELSRLTEGISFKSVSFSYPGSQVKIIDDLDLFVPAGRIVALVGVNGAGKTTLIKLLSRFYDPTSGSIEFDGVDVRKFEPTELRRMMSVLAQFPMQFHAVASDNIALGDLASERREERAVNAAIAAGAHDFISKLPDEYNTLLGKWFVDGTELSGGEWQRIALARAYFRQAPIVILDEPTSFMDPWTEADWFDRFREMVDGKTGIVITHRFTIAMRADVIHVIDQGRIIESGTHRELLREDGFYAASWKDQMQAVGDIERENGDLAAFTTEQCFEEVKVN